MDAKNEHLPEPELDEVDEKASYVKSREFIGPPSPPHSYIPPVVQHRSEPSSNKLPGSYEPLPRQGIVGLVDGLLKKPANVAYEITHGR